MSTETVDWKQDRFSEGMINIMKKVILIENEILHFHIKIEVETIEGYEHVLKLSLQILFM